MSFVKELKHRNVFKVGGVYLVVAWLLIQVSDTLVPTLHLPDWFNSGVVFVLLLGFPIALIFAWAFELTPDGIKKESQVDRSTSIRADTGKKLNLTIIVVLGVALLYMLTDKFFLNTEPETTTVLTTENTAQPEAPETAPSSETASPSSISDTSIAVLPFVNMSSDQEQEYFSDGLSEEMLNLLAKIPNLHVAARTSSFSFKGQNIEIPEIAASLNVANILEGSVRKSGNQIRITAQLIKADSGYHLWSETYDRELIDIFQIQDEIATAVVEALKVNLLGDVPKTSETDPEAYRLFLEGQFFLRQKTTESIYKATELLKSAVEIDPDYAPAWAYLAEAYIWAAATSDLLFTDGNAFELADDAVDMALNKGPRYAFAFSVLAQTQAYNKLQFKEAIKNFSKALSLDPGNAKLIGNSGNAARITGQFDIVIERLQAAAELDPLEPAFYSNMGWAYLHANDLDSAEASFQKTLEISPDFTGAHYRLGRVLKQKGQLDTALEQVTSETNPVYHYTGVAMVQFELGNTRAANEALTQLIDNFADDAAFQIAEIYGASGQTDKAFLWLEESFVTKDSGLASILGDPAFNTMRSDPRWQPFLEKLGLLEYWLKMPAEHGGPLAVIRHDGLQLSNHITFVHYRVAK